MAITVEISKRLVMLNAGGAILTRMLRATILVWMYQYLLRRISGDEFAVYALVTAVMVFAPLFSSFFTSGISRYVIEACARGSEERATQVVSSIFPILLCWGSAIGILGFFFAWHINAFLTVTPAHLADARLMMGMLVVDFAVQMVLTPFAAGFHVRQRFLLLNGIEIAVELFRIGMLFALLFGSGARVIWVVVASVASNALRVTISTVISRRLLPALHVKLALFDWPTAKKLFSFGLWTTLNHLASMIYINGDIIVLNKLATAFDVAIFKLGSEFYNQINVLVAGALGPMQPALTSLHAQADKHRMAEAFLRGARYVLWFSLLPTVPIIIYRYPLIILYAGTHYASAADVLAPLLALFPFMSAGFLLAPIASATAQMRGFCLAQIIVQLIKLGVTLYVVGQLGMGAVGCAISTFVVIGLSHIVVFWPMALRITGTKMRRYSSEVLLRGLAPGVAGGAVWMLLKSLVQPNSWLTLGFCSTVGGLVYVATLLTLCLNDRERGDVSRMYQGLKRKLDLDRALAPDEKVAAISSTFAPQNVDVP